MVLYAFTIIYRYVLTNVIAFSLRVRIEMSSHIISSERIAARYIYIVHSIRIW